MQRGILGIRRTGLRGPGIRLLLVSRGNVIFVAHGLIMCNGPKVCLRYGRVCLHRSSLRRRCRLLRCRRLLCRRRISLRRGRLCGRTGLRTGVGNRL